MSKVQSGDYVKVHYTGTLENGEVFDSSHEREPLEVQVGSGQVIPGFEKALEGMEETEKKTFTLEAAEAYGERDENLKRTFARSDLPEGLDPKVGDTLALQAPNGQQVPVWVSDTTDSEIEVDLNHPLAGKSLTFDIEVMGVSGEPTMGPECGTCSGGGEGGCAC
ncbi:MAG: peptidylprolyl isomerase [Desulfatibacillaceae bacterium]